MAPAQLFTETIDSRSLFTAGQNKIQTFYEEFDRNGSICKSNLTVEKHMVNQRVDAKRGAEDAPIELMEISRHRDVKFVANEDPDATENSSSFADTSSEDDLSDAEAESQFYDENDLAPPFDGLSNAFGLRKKKLTAHWRDYVQPLMWRCKWAEIKIKQLESQASKYSRHLDLHEQTKHMASHIFNVEESSSKSLPYTNEAMRRSPMKRIKRKRVENKSKADTSLYMSNHILFGGHENQRLEGDGGSEVDDVGSSDQQVNEHDDFGLNDDCLFPEDTGDNRLEQILRKIEMVHSKVHALKAQLDTVMNNNTARFSSSENLSQVVQNSSVRSPALSACNEDVNSIEALYDLGDFIMNGAVSNFGDAMNIPDIIESTVGLLSSIDVTQNSPQIGDSSEKIVDNIGTHNETAETEDFGINNNVNQSGEKIQNAENGGGGEESNNIVIEPDSTVKSASSSQEQSSLKLYLGPNLHFPKNKRKRGERKAGSGNWSKLKPGEPDS